MNLDKYTLEANSNFTLFEFTSEGNKGAIPKSIQLQFIGEPNLFNLAFGDKDFTTSDLDDLAISNNGDTEKILATVVSAVIAFSDRNLDALIYATGSTPSRIRLYRIGIVKFYEEVTHHFEIYGQIGDDFYPFEKGKNYIGFLVKRKII